jgi:hypothetical protein
MKPMHDMKVISAPSLEGVIEDGVLIELFKDRWSLMRGGKPIVANRPGTRSIRWLTCGDLERVRRLTALSMSSPHRSRMIYREGR